MLLEDRVTPTGKPTWQAANLPSRVIRNPEEISVEFPVEVKRFYVALKQRGFSMMLTDGATRRVEAAVEKFSEKHDCEAWYRFDYATQEAVILIPGETMTLAEWAAKHREE